MLSYNKPNSSWVAQPINYNEILILYQICRYAQFLLKLKFQGKFQKMDSYSMKGV